MSDLQIFSPVCGEVISLQQVPDPAFSEAMLGNGLAILPKTNIITAPFSGTIISLHKALHAVVLAKDGIELLIHIGIESVSLKGEGFRSFVQVGQDVKQGDKIIEFDLDLLQQKTPCSAVVLVLSAPDGAPVQNAASGQVSVQDLLFTTPALSSDEPEISPVNQPWQHSAPITILNPNGLHARPAGVLAEEAKKYDFPIQIQCDGKVANAKSLVSIMGLSIAKGSQITLQVPQNPAAAQALDTLTQLIKNGLREDPFGFISSAPETAFPNTQPIDLSQTATLRGLCACDGAALGKSQLFKPAEIKITQIATDFATEKNALQKALLATQNDLEKNIAKATQPSRKEILRMHLRLLQDPSLIEDAEQQLLSGKSASAAFDEAVLHSSELLQKSQNEFMMERVADLEDLRRQVLTHLNPQSAQTPDIKQDCILLANELYPSDLDFLEGKAAAVVLAQGSATAHISILLRNMGIPTLVNVGKEILTIKDGTALLLNATEATLTVSPSKEQMEKFAQDKNKKELFLQQARLHAHLPAVTQDGQTISVEGNAGNEKEALDAQENGADGLGLVRTEFLFYHQPTPPTQSQQQDLYQHITTALQGKPVTLRTLDIGGDKPVSYMPLPKEDNPILGLRGIRNYRAHRELFLSQIRAILQTKPLSAVRIMLPMVALVDELMEYKALIEDEKKKLGITQPLQLGIMIEVPSAALQAEQLAAHVDFFSIGTNDLTQYTLAVDRGHQTLGKYLDALHPAVLKLIQMTTQAASAFQKPVAVCGAAAGDWQAAALFIGLGVRELAVGARHIAPLKEMIRHLNTQACADIAQQALSLSNAQQVRQLVKQKLNL